MALASNNWYAVERVGCHKVRIITFDGSCAHTIIDEQNVDGLITDAKIAGKTTGAVALVATTTGLYGMVLTKSGATYNNAVTSIPLPAGQTCHTIRAYNTTWGMGYLQNYSDTISHTFATKIGRITYGGAVNNADVYTETAEYQGVFADNDYVFAFYVVPTGAYQDVYMERHISNNTMSLDNTAYPQSIAGNMTITDVQPGIDDNTIILSVATDGNVLHRIIVQKDNGVSYQSNIMRSINVADDDQGKHITLSNTLYGNKIVNHDPVYTGTLAINSELAFPGNYAHFMANEAFTRWRIYLERLVQ